MVTFFRQCDKFKYVQVNSTLNAVKFNMYQYYNFIKHIKSNESFVTWQFPSEKCVNNN